MNKDVCCRAVGKERAGKLIKKTCVEYSNATN